jgi:hypothetical protein
MWEDSMGGSHTVKKTPETLIYASEEAGLELLLNAEETKYMLLSRYQNVSQNHDIKIEQIKI